MSAAESLRDEGFGGSITVVGQERHPPYDRPPLSKQVLDGRWGVERTRLYDDAFARDRGIDLRLGVRASQLDLDRRIVSAGGDSLPFDHLVIATGVTARRSPDLPALHGLYLLRTIDDTLALLTHLERDVSRVAVVGAGFLGTELAASLRTRGLTVTLVDRNEVPLANRLGRFVGQRIADLHRANGVDLRSGRSLRRVLGEERVTGIELDDGSICPADLVVVSVGSSPATDWLGDSGIPVGDGVLCDAELRAAPRVWAAGDVARWPSRRFGVSLRLEHRMNAVEQGMTVARGIVGMAEPYDAVPYFWSDQFDARLQVYGVVSGADHSDVDETPGPGRFLVRYFREGRLRAVLGWNAPRDVRAARAAWDGQESPSH
jgi:3-phenylpropionate/trans-cinnamate dioxygenase ferredoxin reductase subunit